MYKDVLSRKIKTILHGILIRRKTNSTTWMPILVWWMQHVLSYQWWKKGTNQVSQFRCSSLMILLANSQIYLRLCPEVISKWVKYHARSSMSQAAKWWVNEGLYGQECEMVWQWIYFQIDNEINQQVPNVFANGRGWRLETVWVQKQIKE